MIITSNLANIWRKKYNVVPTQLKKTQQVNSVVCAFNTNIDAVIKISGKTIENLVKSTDFNVNDLNNPNCNIETPKDILRGLIKCFSAGIAEEWLIKNKNTYNWLSDNIGYQRLQMGGQSGIIGNLLALAGIKKVMVHTGSHPKIQAQQFLDLQNLYGLDENGKEQTAAKIVRHTDEPAIHWILEFDKNDIFLFNNKQIKCPKSNRFIATYDETNMNLQINPAFISYMADCKYDYLLLSGFHNLTIEKNGISLINNSADLIKKWKKNNPNGIIHLELASTQDKVIRLNILKALAKSVDSVGLNEREALEALEVLDNEMFEKVKNKKLSSSLLLEIITTIKEKLKVPRIQLHMFGLYITLQNKNYKISPEKNLYGMLTASSVAANKASLGKLEKIEDLFPLFLNKPENIYFEEFLKLNNILHNENFLISGIADYMGYNLAAIPTILVEKPLTLVGMGDTISAMSLISAI